MSNQFASENFINGTFVANAKGFGFVKTDEGQDDLFIGRSNTNLAMQSDNVLASIIHPGKDGRVPEGKIEKILDHANQQVVGIFRSGVDRNVLPSILDPDDFLGTITFIDEKLQEYTYLVDKKGLQAHDRDSVTASTGQFPTVDQPKLLIGSVTNVIGRSDAPGVDILEIVYSLKIPSVYPDKAQAQARAIPQTIDVKAALADGRPDFRDQPLITIDGADTKDIDDAVVVWKLANGHYHLGVHIADVSNYVPEGTPLDEEAYKRGTSVYLTDRVIPMLPTEISNGIASLNPNEDRLAMSCEMEIDEHGQIVHHRIQPSIIRSHARMTYDSINKILAGDVAETAKYADLSDMIHQMGDLHQILAKMRTARGAIEFDSDEAEIIVDKKGHPTDVIVRDRGIGERMIESFMLAANETVAEHFDRLHVPFLYRVHEVPEGDKVTNFFEFMGAIGHPIKADPKNLKPKDFQAALAAVAGLPEEMMIQTMMLRATKQAHYSPLPVGHFGIAAKFYTHFTSPIRRYPDLVVHRLIKHYAKFGTGPDSTAAVRDKLPQIGIDTSARERRSVDAERATNDMKFAEYMEDHIGAVYDGVVNSALKFGLFITLPNTIEGLVHISTMVDDVYQYDETRQALIGRTHHHIFTIGQKVKIQVVNSNKETRKIDFKLIDPQTAPMTKIRLAADPQRRSFSHNNAGGRNQHRPGDGRTQKGAYKSTGKYHLKEGRR
ncbi:ribonuclease R [Oenococcus sicerae]|uniref:ribonuclease R n=1 Tax=Oenococcus sicerae TaxID=2203724 RepID=UPI0039EBB0A3